MTLRACICASLREKTTCVARSFIEKVMQLWTYSHLWYPPLWRTEQCSPCLSVASFVCDSRKHKISAPLQDCIVTAWQLRQVHSFQMSLLQFIFLLCFHVSVRQCLCVCVWQQCGKCIFYLRLISIFFPMYIIFKIDSVVGACWVLWPQKLFWITLKRLFFV